MNLRKLFIIHAIITLAAGVVLVVAPGAIPGTVGIALSTKGYLLCYFLGAAEIALAMLSFGARNVRDAAALRLIVWTFIVFHGLTGVLEVYALYQGGSSGLWANVGLRVLAVGLFAYYGLGRGGKR